MVFGVKRKKRVSDSDDVKKTDQKSVSSAAIVQKKPVKSSNLRRKSSRYLDAADIYDSFRKRPHDFELFCAAVFESHGYTVNRTSASRDGGVDLFMTKAGISYAAECKCWNPQGAKVGSPFLNKIAGANRMFRADHLLIVTTGEFTKPARDFANQANITLISGFELFKLYEQTRVQKL